MQIGFLTNCLRQMDLTEIVPWAGANGFRTLEVACWPHDPNPSLNVDGFDRARADALLELARQSNVTIACLTYCENTLAHDAGQRAAVVQHLLQVIDAANLLDVGTVTTFIGRDESLTQAQNFDEMARVFTPILEHAASRNVRLAIENCPMPGWQFEGLAGNLAYSPLIWDEMFRRLPHANFGLNLDPSHLIWLGVDPYRAASDYAARIFHSHAKDTRVFAEKRERYSIMNSGWNTWWQYRLPGHGDLDWTKWVQTLKASGYDGALCIEHEDPEYEGETERVQAGLVLGKRNLEEALATL